MRLSSPRILIAGAAVAALATAGGVAVAAGDAPAKSAAKTGAAAKADPYAKATAETPKADAKVGVASKKKYVKVPAPSAAALAAANKAAAAADSGQTLVGNGAAPTVASGAATGAAAGGKARAAAYTVVEAGVWTRHNAAPAKMIGKLIFDVDATHYGTCSATVINAANKSTLWTAGHCVRAPGKNGKLGRFYYNFRFVPDLPYKRTAWGVRKVITLDGWNRYGNPAYDIAALVTKSKIQNYTGAQGYAFGYKGRAYRMWSFGYPADRLPGNSAHPDGIPYANNNLLRFCVGNTFGVRYPGVGGVHLGLRCTMGHGASGGPWIYNPSKYGYGRIAGLNSLHSMNSPEMYSPYHGTGAINVYKVASRT